MRDSPKIHQAINLGVVLVDFGYIYLYEQNQHVAKCLSVIQSLMQQLKIETDGSLNAIQRIEANISNSDSLQFLFNEFRNNVE